MGDYEAFFDPILGKPRAKDIFTGSGLLSINGLTPVAQLLTVASAGNDFNIVSSGATHTFNLPTASALNRGALSSSDWSLFNSKLSNISGQDHSTLANLDYASAGHTGFEKTLTFSTGLTRTVDTITTNDSQINHDNLLNFVAGEHFLQSAITQISSSVGDGLVKSTSGALSTITDNSTNWDTAYSWGDHSVEGYLKNIVEDLTPQLGGDLDTNSFDIKFLDNDKAIFGTGLDFEIYSDGNDAILRQLTQDKDIIFNVNNGGGDTEALRIYGNDATKRMEMFGNGFVINGGAFTFIDEGSAANARGEVYSDNSAQNAGFLFIRGRGTYASPAALQSGDDIFSLSTLGFYAAGLSSNQGTFEVETTENWDASNRGIKWILTGTPIGSINRIPHAIFEEGRITLPHTSGVADSAVIKFEEKDTTPTNPTQDIEVKQYMKDDKFIWQFNNGGTVRYFYIDLTQTSAQQVQHTTTAP